MHGGNIDRILHFGPVEPHRLLLRPRQQRRRPPTAARSGSPSGGGRGNTRNVPSSRSPPRWNGGATSRITSGVIPFAGGDK